MYASGVRQEATPIRSGSEKIAAAFWLTKSTVAWVSLCACFISILPAPRRPVSARQWNPGVTVWLKCDASVSRVCLMLLWDASTGTPKPKKKA